MSTHCYSVLSDVSLNCKLSVKKYLQAPVSITTMDTTCSVSLDRHESGRVTPRLLVWQMKTLDIRREAVDGRKRRRVRRTPLMATKRTWVSYLVAAQPTTFRLSDVSKFRWRERCSGSKTQKHMVSFPKRSSFRVNVTVSVPTWQLSRQLLRLQHLVKFQKVLMPAEMAQAVSQSDRMGGAARDQQQEKQLLDSDVSSAKCNSLIILVQQHVSKGIAVPWRKAC